MNFIIFLYTTFFQTNMLSHSGCMKVIC